MVPKASPPTDRATIAEPSQSKCAVAVSFRLSGTCTKVAQSAIRISGTLIRNAARQEIVSTSRPPTKGPRMVVAPEAPAQRPKARPWASPSKLAVRSASDPGTRTAPDARHAEADEPPEEHPPPAVDVAQRAGEDQQRAEGQQVRVVDVRLPLEHPEPAAWQVPADAGEGHVDHRGVEEHDAGPEHRGNQDPSAPVGHLSLLTPWPLLKTAIPLQYSHGHNHRSRAPEPHPSALQGRPAGSPDQIEGAKRPSGSQRSAPLRRDARLHARHQLEVRRPPGGRRNR